MSDRVEEIEFFESGTEAREDDFVVTRWKNQHHRNQNQNQRPKIKRIRSAIKEQQEEVEGEQQIEEGEEGEEDQQLHWFLRENIPELLNHTGLTAFDEHLKGVKTVLQIWNASKDVCNAGLFHSIYGTEGFQGYKFPILRRKEIRKLIGSKAERLVWIFCVVDRKTVDALVSAVNLSQEPPLIHHPLIFKAREELGAFDIPLTCPAEFYEFIQLTLADWLEQVEGAAMKENPSFEWRKGEAWKYRRHAYQKMKNILFQVRQDNYDAMFRMCDEIYSQESSVTKSLHQAETPPMSQAARDAREAIASISL